MYVSVYLLQNIGNYKDDKQVAKLPVQILNSLTSL